MPIKKKDYGRNRKERKEYTYQSGLLLAGNDVCKVKYYVCIGTLQDGMSRIGFSNSRGYSVKR